MNGARFRAYVGTKRGFPALNSSDNASRARSLLCAREALGKPPGAAETDRQLPAFKPIKFYSNNSSRMKMISNY